MVNSDSEFSLNEELNTYSSEDDIEQQVNTISTIEGNIEDEFIQPKPIDDESVESETKNTNKVNKFISNLPKPLKVDTHSTVGGVRYIQTEKKTRARKKKDTSLAEEKELSLKDIFQHRIGQSTQVSSEEFRQSYHFFAASQNEYTDINYKESWKDLDTDDMIVDTPYNVIDKAIDKEIVKYREQIDTLKLTQSTVDKRYTADLQSLIQDFGSSIPSVADLRRPMVNLTLERNQFIKRRIAPWQESAISGSQQMQKVIESKEQKPLLPDQVILRVCVYDNEIYEKQAEFLVLDIQPQTSLRDSIINCIHDLIDDVDWSTQIPLNRPIDDRNTPAGFFFIENTFYDDMRSPRAIRLSDTIIKWVYENDRYLTNDHLYPYTQQNMETTTFSQIKIRLGSHYLYQHQGSCKHTIIFTEMRMKSSDDFDDITLYPLCVFQRKFPMNKCSLCQTFIASMVTEYDKQAPISPCFYCDKCYDLIHKYPDGSYIYTDYRVFRTLPIIQPFLPNNLDTLDNMVSQGDN